MFYSIIVARNKPAYEEMVLLAQQIKMTEILACVRNFYHTHVILPRLSHVDHPLVVLELTHMVVNVFVKVTSSCNIASKHIQ